MRSVDDAHDVVIPVRRRSWTDTNGFSKRNKTKRVPLVAPKRIPPEKQTGKTRPATQFKFISGRCPHCGIYSNFVCCEND